MSCVQCIHYAYIATNIQAFYENEDSFVQCCRAPLEDTFLFVTRDDDHDDHDDDDDDDDCSFAGLINTTRCVGDVFLLSFGKGNETSWMERRKKKMILDFSYPLEQLVHDTRTRRD